MNKLTVVKQASFVISAILVTLLLSGCSSKHSQATPEKAMAYAIYLLEEKKYDELIDNLVDPTYLSRFKKGKIDKIKQYFKKSSKPSRMLKTLKAIDKSKKKILSDSLVEFIVTGAPKNLKLIKIGNKWYIRN